MTTKQTTLILGGTGKTGSRVARRLTDRGMPVRIASRSATPAFDWDDKNTWAPMLRGADALYIAYPLDLSSPEAAGNIRVLSKLAVESGVRKIVFLSGRGEPHVYPSEQAVRESGASHTIVRCSWFAQNFSEGHMRGAVMSGELAFPAGNIAEPFVDLDDVADVAVAALVDDKHAGKTYDLTGPRVLTFAEATSEIAKASGRDVRYTPISFEAYREVLTGFMPAEAAQFLTELFTFILDGHNAYVDDDVERILGRKPRDFSEFARDAAKAGAWAR